jgi:hypothetical protein
MMCGADRTFRLILSESHVLRHHGGKPGKLAGAAGCAGLSMDTRMDIKTLVI